ncbi:MAG: ATP-binding cassette domain-containing protein [Clostridiaceae bacterium]|nr:ATP-binding cassette domain-containing protein [Clostridiaceae bacterium]
MIELSHIQKTFHVARRNSGLGEAAKALLRREYTEVRALDDLSFSVGAGEIVGYIGPNGAGKSSTVKVMSGILTPDSGACEVCGLTPWKDRKKLARHIGVVFGQRSQLFWDVPVIDSFELLRDIYEVERLEYRENLGRLTALLNLTDLLRTPARQLSLGQRMRCELAASLLHSPQVLFLDEPTIGLDAVSKIAVRQFIRDLSREKGTTVILTTHDMQDIEALASRILLIGRGRILLDGTLDELRRAHSPLRTITAEYLGTLPLLRGVTAAETQPGRAVLTVDTNVCSVSEVIAALSAAVELHDLSVTGQSAEELVAGLYRDLQI